jgi:hypothetical protein
MRTEWAQRFNEHCPCNFHVEHEVGRNGETVQIGREIGTTGGREGREAGTPPKRARIEIKGAKA